jgi:3-hydroxyacyl-[acyl-carrier-protein] dehydratase
VPADHPALAGHFPGRPIVPGVVLLDRVLLLAQELLGEPPAGWQINQVKFLKPCAPLDLLHFELRLAPSGSCSFSVCLGELEAASGSLVQLLV